MIPWSNPTLSGSYHQTKTVQRSKEYYPERQDVVYAQHVYQDNKYVSHVRNSYNFLDFLGSISGVLDTFLYTITFFLASLPGMNSLLAIMNRLFVVRTSIDNIFEESSEQKFGSIDKIKKKNEYLIDFKICQLLHYKLQHIRCGLCLSWDCLKCIPYFKKYRRVKKLMKKGEEKLMDSISVQVIYHTLKQHSEAFKKMGI